MVLKAEPLPTLMLICSRVIISLMTQRLSELNLWSAIRVKKKVILALAMISILRSSSHRSFAPTSPKKTCSAGRVTRSALACIESSYRTKIWRRIIEAASQIRFKVVLRVVRGLLNLSYGQIPTCRTKFTLTSNSL